MISSSELEELDRAVWLTGDPGRELLAPVPCVNAADFIRRYGGQSSPESLVAGTATEQERL
jgi:hypothetical protein